MENKLL